MKKLFDAMTAALQRKENVVLCTILASSGSTPRGAGARMAVFADGTTVGTVGGGAVELAAQQQAMEVHRTGRSAMQAYCLAPNQVADLGMVCGGDVTVYFQHFSAEEQQNQPLLQALAEAVSGSENAWLVMELRNGSVCQTGLYCAGTLQFAHIPEETLQPLLQSRAVLQKGEPSWYAEPIRRAGTVYIFGGGHVSQALVPILKSVAFSVAVYDPRPALACAEKFPLADRIICGEFTDIGALPITADDYVVIMTPGHQADREVLSQALRTQARYVGCIGSRRKLSATREYLAQQGLGEEQWQRVHAPIGIPLGGETPAEIAISITAELIAHRSGYEKQNNKNLF